MSKFIDANEVHVNDPRVPAVAWLLRSAVDKNLSFMETAATVVAWHNNETVRQAEEIERLKGVGDRLREKLSKNFWSFDLDKIDLG